MIVELVHNAAAAATRAGVPEWVQFELRGLGVSAWRGRRVLGPPLACVAALAAPERVDGLVTGDEFS